MRTRKQVFFILWFAAITSSVLVLPYYLDLVRKEMPIYRLILGTIVNSSIIFGVSTWFGLIFADKFKFNLKLLYGEAVQDKWKYLVTPGILGGLIVGISLPLLDKLFSLPEKLTFSGNKISPLKGLFASFYGAINEEILLRLFLMLFIIFLLQKVFGKSFSRSMIVFVSVVLAAIVFGVGHLPAVASIVPLSFSLTVRTLLLNGVAGMVFGYIFFVCGLEAAMFAHFVADIILHVLIPLIL